MSRLPIVPIVIVCCVLPTAMLCAQDVPDWENPAVFARNKLAPRATFFGYENREGFDFSIPVGADKRLVGPVVTGAGPVTVQPGLAAVDMAPASISANRRFNSSVKSRLASLLRP